MVEDLLVGSRPGTNTKCFSIAKHEGEVNREANREAENNRT